MQGISDHEHEKIPMMVNLAISNLHSHSCAHVHTRDKPHVWIKG